MHSGARRVAKWSVAGQSLKLVARPQSITHPSSDHARACASQLLRRPVVSHAHWGEGLAGLVTRWLTGQEGSPPRPRPPRFVARGESAEKKPVHRALSRGELSEFGLVGLFSWFLSGVSRREFCLLLYATLKLFIYPLTHSPPSPLFLLQGMYSPPTSP